MIQGQVSAEGVPTCYIEVAGRTWMATIDTGFNGYLELPGALQGQLNDRYRGEIPVVPRWRSDACRRLLSR